MIKSIMNKEQTPAQSSVLNSSEKGLIDLIGLIYDASYEPSKWVDVLEGVTDLTESKSSALMYRDEDQPAANFNFSYGFSQEIVHAYETKYYAVDPFFKLSAETTPIGSSSGDHEMVPDRRQLEEICGEFFTGYMKPFDIWHCGGVNLFLDEDRYAAVSIHRGRKQGPWHREHMQKLDILVPHFQRAFRIHKEFTRMRLKEQALLLALDRLVIGLVLLDSNEKIVYSNPMADRILAEHPAIQLSADNTLRASDSKEAVRLNGLIQHAAKEDSNDTTDFCNALGLRHRKTTLPLPVLVTPVGRAGIPGASAIDGAKIALLMTDPEKSRAISPSTLCEAYGLTQTEAMVAIGIANGMTVNEITQAHGTTSNTVRSQLKNIFAKVNVSRQAELVKTLLTGPYNLFGY
jgi:DNA-binding CsgD family transcriptional regulator